MRGAQRRSNDALKSYCCSPRNDEHKEEKTTVACMSRELPMAFYVINNASREPLAGDYHSTDILSLTGQAFFSKLKFSKICQI
ncbi:MAG: hypothetical protein LBF04_02755 [Prevotellaceae bacterium]|nr:hypothetical protein [Prevotellaceae bacterium]